MKQDIEETTQAKGASKTFLACFLKWLFVTNKMKRKKKFKDTHTHKNTAEKNNVLLLNKRHLRSFNDSRFYDQVIKLKI